MSIIPTIPTIPTMPISVIPVITVDGPGGSGKGTLSRRLASKLNFHFLDSGALYRVLAFAAHARKIEASPNNPALLALATSLDIAFKADPLGGATKIILDNQDVTSDIRTEACGEAASKMAVLPCVRAALLVRQRAFLLAPGLVADGRDMGTVVFPNAQLKIFLEASLEERAKRRYKELQMKDLNVSLEAVLMIIAQRDERDRMRVNSPLIPATDAVIIDTTTMDSQQVFDHVMTIYKMINIKI